MVDILDELPTGPTDSATLTAPFPEKTQEPEQVDHPAHYGGANNPYEVIKVLEAWGLDKS